MYEEHIQPVNENKDASTEAPKPDETTPVTTVDVGKVESPKHSYTPDADKNRRKRKPLSCFEICTLILGGLGILVAAGTGIAIFWQAKISAWTLAEIKKGGTDTHDLAVAAKAQSDKMSNMADAADKIRQAAEGMVAQEQRIANNASMALDATVAEMQTQTRLAVRPWVGLDDEVQAPFQNGPLHIDEKGFVMLPYKIQIRNFSNAPAHNVFPFVIVVVADDAETINQRQKEACDDRYIGNPDIGFLLFQGKDRIFTTTIASGKVELRHPTGYGIDVWLVGCVGYRDQFGYLYHTEFSGYMVDSSGKTIQWMAPPKGVMDVNGAFIFLNGSIDSGRPPKRHEQKQPN